LDAHWCGAVDRDVWEKGVCGYLSHYEELWDGMGRGILKLFEDLEIIKG